MMREVAPGVWYVPALMSNVYFVGGTNEPWVLIDTGTPGTAGWIQSCARSVYGTRPPEAIILTHGHFDHVGALEDLLRDWNVPVHAHPLEWPYLDGRDNYPPPDPTTGGFMAQLSRVFPKHGIRLPHGVLHTMPMDNSVPRLPGWRMLHTPGHSPGHISLFRDVDRVLIAGDAVITIDQQNPVKLASQAREVFPPPRYFTIDWGQARQSVEKLANLRPNVIATGHGLPLEGESASTSLRQLADTFDSKMPAHGRYVDSPALADEQGVYYVPPKPFDPTLRYAAGVALVAAGALAISMRERKSAGKLTMPH